MYLVLRFMFEILMVVVISNETVFIVH